MKWKQSKRYLATRRRKATRERRLAAHRKSLHGRLVHEIVAVGTTIITEKIAYRARPQQFGKSVGLRAPGMFIELLRRTVASTGGTLVEVSTRQTKLSQFCHGCGQFVTKPLWQRWHHCACGISSRSATSTRRFWPPISTQQIPFPRVPRYAAGLGRCGAPPAGSIRASSPTCECGAASASLLRYPRRRERVCPKVQASPHKSPPASQQRQETWKPGKERARALTRRGLRAERPHLLRGVNRCLNLETERDKSCFCRSHIIQPISVPAAFRWVMT